MKPKGEEFRGLELRMKGREASEKSLRSSPFLTPQKISDSRRNSEKRREESIRMAALEKENEKLKMEN